MIRTSSMLRVFVVLALLCAGVAYSQSAPARNIDPKISPNLASAQTYITDAWNKVVLAQKVNNFDMAGHADNARNDLVQASNELYLAAQAAYAHTK